MPVHQQYAFPSLLFYFCFPFSTGHCASYKGHAPLSRQLSAQSMLVWLIADWEDLQTLKWAQTVDPHQSEECELLLETYSMQVCNPDAAISACS